jgi:putative addiction module component (TIGR02574 family)
MSRATLEEVRRQALELNESERESLIRDLIASFDGPPDPDRDEAWSVEIQRRLKEIDDGTAEFVDFDEMLKRIGRPRRE